MAATDDFVGRGPKDDPYTDAVAITPSDSVDLTHVTRAVYVGGAGDVTAVMQGSGVVTFKAPPVGTTLRIRATRINSTGTTATLLIALW